MDKRSELAERYDKLYRYCYFKVHSKELAQDIVQEAFLRYLEHYRYRGKEWDMRYLYRIAHNLCVDEWRRKTVESIPAQYEEHMSYMQTETLPLGQSGSARDHADDAVTVLWLKNAMAKLSEEEQELLLLRYANEIPAGVICRMLGISRFALYRKIQKALRTLREEMENE